MDSLVTHTVINVRNMTAEGHADADQPIWLIETSVDGSAVPSHAHRFPHEALHWRAAEYGIDPSDFDTLLEVVLCEPQMSLQHTDPAFLYNTDEKAAREAHLKRVADVRARVAHLDPDGLLDRIRAEHDPADPRIEKSREHVHGIRSRIEKGRLRGPVKNEA
jgi:hypothetical protein